MEIEQLHSAYESMDFYDTDWLESAIMAMPFYTGGYGVGQWDDVQLQKLEDEERAPLQLNITLPKINLLTGIERQNRTFWKMNAVGIEDEVWKQLITPLLLYVERTQTLQQKFSRGFKYAGITGRDWLELKIREDGEFGLDITIDRESWHNVRIDPDARVQNTEKWLRLSREKWLTFEEIKALFPDQVDDIKDIKGMRYPHGHFGLDPSEGLEFEHGDRYEYGDRIDWSKHYDEKSKRIRVVDYWDREIKSTSRVVDLKNGSISKEPFESKGSAKKELSKVAKSEGRDKEEYSVITKIESDIYLTEWSGSRILQERKKEIYNHKQFPLVPIWYYFEDMGHRVETIGMVENLKYPQMEKNKRRSQSLDVLSRVPKGGGIIDKAAGITADTLKKVSSAGEWIVAKMKPGKKLGDIMQQWSMGAIQLLGFIENLETRAELDTKEISGATDPLLGVASAAKESGLAARTRISQGMLTLQEPLEYLDDTKKQVLRMIISMMQQFYSPEKIRRIVDLEAEGFDKEDVEKFITAFKDEKDLLQYDIILSKTDNPTLKSLKAAEIGDILKQIPAYAPALLPIWVELSDLDSKEELLEAIQTAALQQQAAASNQKGES